MADTNIIFCYWHTCFLNHTNHFCKDVFARFLHHKTFLRFSLRLYCSMMSASLTGDISPAAEHRIFLSSSTAQKPQRKGLEKTFLQSTLVPNMTVQMTLPSTPGPVLLTRWVLPTFFFAGFWVEVEFVRDGSTLMIVLTIILKRLNKQPMLIIKFITIIRLIITWNNSSLFFYEVSRLRTLTITISHETWRPLLTSIIGTDTRGRWFSYKRHLIETGDWKKVCKRSLFSRWVIGLLAYRNCNNEIKSAGK